MNSSQYQINGIRLDSIRNRNEIKIIHLLKELLPLYPDFDGCPICIQDVYALALNRTAPHYVQSGTIILKKAADREDEKILQDIVRSAIETVIKYPKHPV